MPRKMTEERKKSRYSYDPQRENASLPVILSGLMKEQGITQAALGEKIGISRQSIANYAMGRVFPPSGVLDKLSQYFGVTTDYLLGKTDCPTNTPDKRIACDYSGLSSDAMDRLHTTRPGKSSHYTENSRAEMLSFLICQDDFWILLDHLTKLLSEIEHAEGLISGEMDIEELYDYYQIYYDKNGHNLDEVIYSRCRGYLRDLAYDLAISSKFFDQFVLRASEVATKLDEERYAIIQHRMGKTGEPL